MLTTVASICVVPWVQAQVNAGNVVDQATSADAAFQTGSASGKITDVYGAAVPGSTVTLVGGASEWTARTNGAGVYSFAWLPPGLYEMRAELSGFCDEIRPDLRVAPGDSLVVNLTLHLGPNDWEYRPQPRSLPDAHHAADAVVHLQISRALGLRLLRTDRIRGGVTVGIEYEARILDALKVNPFHESEGRVLRFVQYPSGELFNGERTFCGFDPPYSAGEQYVVFLEWSEELGQLRFLGPRYVFPV